MPHAAPARPLADGDSLHALARRLFPIHRSLTGDGVRETLRILAEFVPLTLHEVPSGTRAFDWVVPDEWNLREAWITGPDGAKVLDARDHTLHVVGYSVPVDAELDLADLQPHLHTLPGQPDAIPYVTSYYRREWGFCLTQRQRDALRPGRYRVRIDATLAPGHLTYGELRIPGQSPDRELFFSTYVCHPSMANNELSGPVIAAALARWLSDRPNRLAMRFVWLPETIGSLVYLSRHLEELRRRVAAGFVLTCLGDEGTPSFLPSRRGDTLADRAARCVLSHLAPGFREHDFLERGSDERQYCSPGADLPICSVMRTKYHTFPQYHTSLDDLEFVTAKGLDTSLQILKRCVEVLDANAIPQARIVGEPQLERHGLYRRPGEPGGFPPRLLLDLMAFADGRRDLIGLSDRLGVPPWELAGPARTLADAGLLHLADADSPNPPRP